MVACLEDAVDAAGFKVFLDAIGASLVCNIFHNSRKHPFLAGEELLLRALLKPSVYG
jgi:hypothetical protein